MSDRHNNQTFCSLRWGSLLLLLVLMTDYWGLAHGAPQQQQQQRQDEPTTTTATTIEETTVASLSEHDVLQSTRRKAVQTKEAPEDDGGDGVVHASGGEDATAAYYTLYYRSGGYADLSRVTWTRGDRTTSVLRVSWIPIPPSLCPDAPSTTSLAAADDACPPVRWVKALRFGRYLDDTWHICCTAEAVHAGACASSQRGHLVSGGGDDDANWQTYPIHLQGDGASRFSTALSAPTAGYYALVLSDCSADGGGLNGIDVNDDGVLRFVTDPRNPPDDDVGVYYVDPPQRGGGTGADDGEEDAAVTNNNNYPPGHIVVPLHLLGMLSYLVLLGWFSSRMRGGSGGESSYHNTIEDWIGRTIAIGLCAVVLRCLEYLLYDHTGHRHPVVAAVTAFGYAVKHGLTRALLVGLSTGVGVLPSRLRCCCTLCNLVVMTLVYTAVVTALDYWAFVQDFQRVDDPIDEAQIPVRKALLISKATMEIIFWLWIWRALCVTTGDLERMNRQSAFRFRCLFWVMVVLAVLSGCVFWAVLSDRTDYGSVGLGENRYLSQLDEVVVFFMLLSIAILWRPLDFGIVSLGADLEMMQGITESNPDVDDDDPPDGTFKIS